ncbi:uncharacterized protein DNG_06638 [Cephalotrichum gorgonifer]|uniref:60KD_IMP domain-containing protein n=1 Tax=Cephalotrichum gorgonifer TaxID=2041049 RepID=A0AAE8N338_9PEZI|nr:uncharacterized protein DNG_06638 [Cephalotrichum gorgonifer]
MAAHSFTGLPWFLVIPAASVVFSAVTTVPLLPYTRRYANRLSRLQPLFYAWHQKARFLKLKDPVASANTEIKRIRKDAGLQGWKPYLRLMLSLPPWIIVSGAMRHISMVDPTFTNEGFLWFTDLTVADPLYILPTILVGSMLALMGPRSLAEAWDLIDVHDKSAKTRRSRMVVVAAPFLFNFISTYPSGMLFFWLLTGSTNRALTKVADKLILPPVEKNPWAERATTEPWHIDGPK